MAIEAQVAVRDYCKTVPWMISIDELLKDVGSSYIGICLTNEELLGPSRLDEILFKRHSKSRHNYLDKGAFVVAKQYGEKLDCRGIITTI